VEVGDSLQLFELGSDLFVPLASDDGRWWENLLQLESGSLVGYPQSFVLLL
jgi:hypothetical protein